MEKGVDVNFPVAMVMVGGPASSMGIIQLFRLVHGDFVEQRVLFHVCRTSLSMVRGEPVKLVNKEDLVNCQSIV